MMLPVEYESKVVTEILVERVTSYYMLNFTLVVGLLTVMSWVSFFLSATDLNDRATLSLTIILALNVFQLIMNDSMPKTGYLTPLTQFIIGSTFFAAFATVESVAVFILNRRTVTREEVIQKFRSRTQSAVSAAFGRGGSKNESKVDITNADSPSEAASLRDEEGKGTIQAMVANHMRMAEVEKLLANNLDFFCIGFLPIAYALMTVIIFGFY